LHHIREKLNSNCIVPHDIFEGCIAALIWLKKQSKAEKCKELQKPKEGKKAAPKKRENNKEGKKKKVKKEFTSACILLSPCAELYGIACLN